MNDHNKPIRVMIVEDTVPVRLLLEHIIDNDPRLTVASSVASGEEALRTLKAVKPDVISLDIRLPGINGFEVTRAIMAEQPTPIVVLSADIDDSELRISMNALKAGALSIVEKPVGVTHADYAHVAERLCRQLVLMSDVRPMRLPGTRKPTAPSGVSAFSQKLPVQERRVPKGPHRVLGIVASTGGPNAVVTVLQSLGPDTNIPIVLVQHIMPSFLSGFATWLSDVCGLQTRIVGHNERLSPGVIHMAPPDRHICVDGATARLTDTPCIDGQRPSGTVLFESMAKTIGAQGIGVLLTGMGSDGADGLLALHCAGGITLAEDASTAVVYGMPKVAVELGAVDEQLPLHQIGPRLRDLTTALRVVS